MKPDEKKITIFIADDLHMAAKVKIAQGHAKSFQDILNRFLRQWVDGEKALPKETAPRVAADSDDVRRLRWIMENGTEKDQEWIRGNLINFQEAIRSRQSDGIKGKRASIS